jgi:probable rRNA maturation factor
MKATPPSPEPTPPALALSVQTGSGIAAVPVTRPRLRRWVLAALQGDARITLRFVGTREGRTLNREHRGRDYATNVLTFAYDPLPAPPAGPSSTRRRTTAPPSPPVEADIVLCMPVIRAEARAQDKPLDHHLAHLVIHGVLHAQGFDHEDENEAQAMERLEAALLRRLRVPDPYAAERDGAH